MVSLICSTNPIFQKVKMIPVNIAAVPSQAHIFNYTIALEKGLQSIYLDSLSEPHC